MRLFIVLATAFACWFLQAILYRRLWRRGLKVDLSFNRPYATEGETASLTETIVNAKTLPIPVLHVKFQLGRELVFPSGSNAKVTDRSYRSDIFSCMPWQQIRRELTFTCKKRGYFAVDHLELVSSDLFFTENFTAAQPAHTALCVYPAPADMRQLEFPLSQLIGSVRSEQSLQADPFELRSIRAYEPFDPYRSINWKATAKTGALKVNVYAPTISRKVALLLDTGSNQSWEDADLIEESIRICGSLACALIDAGIPVSLASCGIDCLTGQEIALNAGAGPEHGRAILELLARLDLEQAPVRTIEEFILSLAGAASAGSPSLQHGDTLFALISTRQRSSLAESFEALCRLCPGSQWILPIKAGEFCTLRDLDSCTLYEWEVSDSHA